MTAFSAAKKVVSKAVTLASRANQGLPTSRANELRLSVAGGAVGAIGGAVLVGGMGLAALGTAFAVSGPLAVGTIGVIAGNKLGSEIDRWRTSNRKSDD